jgi:superoxide dismutase, Fe-Mn family
MNIATFECNRPSRIVRDFGNSCLALDKIGHQMTMITNSPYELPSLTYDRNALAPVISEEIMTLHHGTHHQAYVKSANETLEKLSELPPTADPSALLRALSFHVSGHVLHSLFWNSITPNGGGAPSGSLTTHVSASFGSVENLINRMTLTVEKLSGSGWAALVWEPMSRRLLVTQIHDHQHDQISGTTPVMVIDGWEHAYYLQYGAAKAKWAKAFWDIADWKGVEARVEALAGVPAFV